jgi:hypothetical protein
LGLFFFNHQIPHSTHIRLSSMRRLHGPPLSTPRLTLTTNGARSSCHLTLTSLRSQLWNNPHFHLLHPLQLSKIPKNARVTCFDYPIHTMTLLMSRWTMSSTHHPQSQAQPIIHSITIVSHHYPAKNKRFLIEHKAIATREGQEQGVWVEQNGWKQILRLSYTRHHLLHHPHLDLSVQEDSFSMASLPSPRWVGEGRGEKLQLNELVQFAWLCDDFCGVLHSQTDCRVINVTWKLQRKLNMLNLPTNTTNTTTHHWTSIRSHV